MTPAAPSTRPGRLSKRASFLLLASIVVSFLAGSSAATPLYAVYQAAWGFSPVTVTVVFGVYALAVLASLLVVGSLSDHVGRRPVLLVATLMQVVTMGLFVTAHGVGALLAARVVQGIATGAAVGAAGAGMLDLDRDRGTVANGVGPVLGTATGSLLSGLLVQFLPLPTKLVYLVLGAVFLVQMAGVHAMPESATTTPGALASLRPRLRVPAHLRGAVLVAAPALVGAWALAGFYGSLGPSLVRRLAGSGSPALGGLSLFVLAAGGAVTVLVSRTRPAHVATALGTAALALGVGVTLIAIDRASVAVFFVGTAVAGAGFGAAFHGAIRSVLSLAAPHERAGVLSVLYVIAYLSMGLPAILAGVRVVHGGGIVTTADEYGLGVMALAMAAMAGTWWRRPTPQWA
ncbi:MAG TPA: MFS transporter [Polyangiaceae bacterium]|nr:MFS transporter [Polyangiaceae bacterium]